MEDIEKRLINVILIVPTLYLILIAVTTISGGVTDWPRFIFYNYGGVLGAYGAIAVLNYILFGRVTLWHKSKKNGSAS